MRVLDFFVMLFLFVLLAVGMYLLWWNFPTQSTEFELYVANLSLDLPNESSQFHPNMRYPDREISYFLSQNCSARKKNDFEGAVEFLERRTILSFYESRISPEIWVTCSNVAPEPNEEGHFIAGEGGPSTILNATQYAVIMTGKVALYRDEACDTPQVATHEILHALGFDHNSNPDSIMYPVTNCDQEIDQHIINEIRDLYSVPSAADLVIESVKANKTGRYLNFEAVIANYGLKGVEESKLKVIVDGSVIEEFESEDIDIGAKKSLTVTMGVPRKTE
ncbi:MAG: matrixin family metalloprotease, partial [Nanoarchaeota archaeon]